MRQRLIILVIVMSTSLLTFGQAKIYYDTDWNGCAKYEAEYFRICTFDKTGKPIGKIRDYFITGELQGIADGALTINKYNDSKSVFIGITKGYYKNGKISFERKNNSSGVIIYSKHYSENGSLNSEYYYRNGKLYYNSINTSNGKYSGNIKNGKYNGKGTYTWNTGDKYVGNWIEGNRTGSGVYYYSNGDIYEGSFVNGKKEGIGNYYWAGGGARLGCRYSNNSYVDGTGSYSKDSKYNSKSSNIRKSDKQNNYTNCDVDFSKYSGGSYLSKVNNAVNLREGPSTSCSVLKTLQWGEQVFVLSSKGTNGFYPVIDLNSNKRGFVSKSYVTLGEYYAASSKPMFSKSGYSSTYKSKIEVYNNTSKTLSLDLGSSTYTLSPHQRKTIHVSPGNLFYLASASGVLPAKGTQKFESNSGYSWEFYIQTSYY